MARQSQLKHQRLMEKAEELLWKYGCSSVSMDQIASEAGISKMTIYKHFSSKDEMVAEVIISNARRQIDIIEKELDKKEHALDKITYLCSYSVKATDEYPAILIKDIVERPYLLEKIKAYKQEWAMTLWRKILEDGMEKGEIRQLDVEFTALLLNQLPMALINTDFLANASRQKDYLEKLFDFMEYGLLGK